MGYNIKNAVTSLLILNIVFFIVQTFLGRDFTSAFMLVSSDILTRPWILITHMFLHGSPYHLFFNMYVLYIFGPLLEQRIGSKRFLLVYFTSGLISAFAASLFYGAVLGASGAIMGMLGVIIILLPELQILFFFIVPMRLWVAAFIIALIDIFGIFYSSGIANIGHLAGLGTGLLYGLYLKKQKIKFQKKFSSKKHLDDDDMEEYLQSGRI